MRALLALTFSLALLAGCTSSPASDPAPASGADAAPGVAGNDGGSTGDAAPAPLATVTQPVQLDGRTQAGACVGLAGQVGDCAQFLPEGNFAMLGAGTDLVRLAGDLTWTAITPATERLSIMVLVCEDQQGNGCQNHGDYPYAAGPSPLHIDWDLLGETDQPVGLWVAHYLGQGAAGSYATGMAPQAFAFDGTLEVLA